MDLELEQVCARWEKLSSRERSVILVVAGVREALPARQTNAVGRKPKGEVPAWLVTALNLLRDSDGKMSNREIARRLSISHTVLTRNRTFQQAREAYPFDGLKRHKPGRSIAERSTTDGAYKPGREGVRGKGLGVRGTAPVTSTSKELEDDE